MSDGMGRELAYLSSHATNRYFIPNWGIYYKIISATNISISFSNNFAPDNSTYRTIGDEFSLYIHFPHRQDLMLLPSLSTDLIGLMPNTIT